MSEEEAVDREQSVNSEANKPPRQLEADTPPLQGESLNGTAPVEKDTAKQSLTVPPNQTKTQGVRSGRSDGGRRVLERAAKAAARTGNRGDVHAYMRIRRNFV